MSNGTLWPLFHDVIAAPEYHRHWWDAYVEVNQRFADAAAAQAAEGATVWVQDYQLLLVPARLREQRPDLRIGFFNHIPFPGYEIFSQLPWRRQVVEGVLGADLVGFQRRSDATNFLRACRRAGDVTTKGGTVQVDGRRAGAGAWSAPARSPSRIDARGFEELAASPDVVARAEQIRKELGDPETVLLGVDRLDYTKGIRHRLTCFAELLEDGELDPESTVLVQVASPSRERVQAYSDLRDEVELTVGRINGDHGTVGFQPVHYLHQSFPREEMAALYLAADVMLVTALRDGMNLVAKEYVAARHDGDGVLVLSEFAGAADELTQALLINPHDIAGTKAAIMRAARMPRRGAPAPDARAAPAGRRARRRALGRRTSSARSRASRAAGRRVSGDRHPRPARGRRRPSTRRRPSSRSPPASPCWSPSTSTACAPRSSTTRRPRGCCPGTREALRALAGAGCRVALVSGRGLASLREVAEPEPGLAAGRGPRGRAGQRRGRDGSTRRRGRPARPRRARPLADVVQAALPGSPRGRGTWPTARHVRRAQVRPGRCCTPARRRGVAAPPSRARRARPPARRPRQAGQRRRRARRPPGRQGQRRQALLRAQTGAASVLYVGDDVTDEDAFAVLDPLAGRRRGQGRRRRHRGRPPGGRAAGRHRCCSRLAPAPRRDPHQARGARGPPATPGRRVPRWTPMPVPPSTGSCPSPRSPGWSTSTATAWTSATPTGSCRVVVRRGLAGRPGRGVPRPRRDPRRGAAAVGRLRPDAPLERQPRPRRRARRGPRHG